MYSDNKLQTVMLVDDNNMDNFIAQRIIEMTGFAEKVIAASCALEALGYLTINATSPGQLPQLIFLDIAMPLSDGFDFLKKFKSLGYTVTSKCKVVILSSSIHRKDIARILMDHHVIRFMAKPMSAEALEQLSYIAT